MKLKSKNVLQSRIGLVFLSLLTIFTDILCRFTNENAEIRYTGGKPIAHLNPVD